jgi:hypothetical protein
MTTDPLLKPCHSVPIRRRHGHYVVAYVSERRRHRRAFDRLDQARDNARIYQRLG